ncbi:MAG: hypothetical protein ACH350_02095 [Parachlamydiaceae bacterium]
MGQVYLKVKDVDEFFMELHSRCMGRNCYSLLETISQMGATIEEVEKWAQSNEQWLYTVQLCLQLCCLHINEAELIGGLSEEQAFFYLSQNRSLINLS